MKRSLDYFAKMMKENDVSGMTEFCQGAWFIYETWRDSGESGLLEYLLNQLEIPEKYAKLIAKNYQPKCPPTDFCPISVVKDNKHDKVFEMLSLQLLGKNEGGMWPKNLLAWYLKKHIYGADVFDFEIVGKTGEQNDNHINFSNCMIAEDGDYLPFGLAALNIVKVGEIPSSVIKKANILISALGEIGIEMSKMFLKTEIIFPPKKILNNLAKALKKGLNGEEVVLYSIFCPDYSYTKVNDPEKPGIKYEYTFDELGDSIGLVAQQIRRVLPELAKIFDKYNVKYRIAVAIADFEGNSVEILKSVNVDKEEFDVKCSLSLKAFQESLSDLKMDLFLFEKNLSNGNLKKYCREISKQMYSGDFGEVYSRTGKNPQREIEFIAEDGKSFYRRWYKKPEMTIDKIRQIVLSQAAEYAAVGKIGAETFADRPVIQIAGDRPKMQIFNNFASENPVICCRRIY